LVMKFFTRNFATIPSLLRITNTIHCSDTSLHRNPHGIG
jgi:hypothetical protein